MSSRLDIVGATGGNGHDVAVRLKNSSKDGTIFCVNGTFGRGG